jgi:hypothetical protein
MSFDEVFPVTESWRQAVQLINEADLYEFSRIVQHLSEGDSSESLESGNLDDTVAFMFRWLGFHGVHDADQVRRVLQSASQSDHQFSNDKLEVIVAGWVACGKRHISQARRNVTETVCHPPPLPCVHNNFIAISTKVRIASGGVVEVEVPDTVSNPSLVYGVESGMHDTVAVVRLPATVHHPNGCRMELSRTSAYELFKDLDDAQQELDRVLGHTN